MNYQVWIIHFAISAYVVPLIVSFFVGFYLARKMERKRAKDLFDYVQFDTDDADQWRAEHAQGIIARYKEATR